MLLLPFYGPLSGTTQVSRCQNKHSPTHTCRDHWSSIILYLLPPSTTIHSILPVQFTYLTVFLHKIEWWGAGMVIHLEQMQMIYIWSSWCYCHPVISWLIKIPSGFTFLVLVCPGCSGKKAIKWMLLFSAQQCTQKWKMTIINIYSWQTLMIIDRDISN